MEATSDSNSIFFLFCVKPISLPDVLSLVSLYKAESLSLASSRLEEDESI